MFKVIIGKVMILDFWKVKDLSLVGIENFDNVIMKYVVYGEGFVFLLMGKFGLVILFSFFKLEVKCRFLIFFFFDDGMIG